MHCRYELLVSYEEGKPNRYRCTRAHERATVKCEFERLRW